MKIFNKREWMIVIISVLATSILIMLVTGVFLSFSFPAGGADTRTSLQDVTDLPSEHFFVSELSMYYQPQFFNEALEYYELDYVPETVDNPSTEEIVEALEEQYEEYLDEPVDMQLDEIEETAYVAVPVVYSSWGRPFNVLVDGMYYQPQFFDEVFGHFEDLVGTRFEYVKPDFFQNTYFGDVRFSNMPFLARYLPAFIMFDAMQFTYIPEEELTRWLADETTYGILHLRRNGKHSCDGTHHEWEFSSNPPSYNRVEVVGMESEAGRYTFIVRIENSFQSYTQRFERQDDGRLRSIRAR